MQNSMNQSGNKRFDMIQHVGEPVSISMAILIFLLRLTMAPAQTTIVRNQIRELARRNIRLVKAKSDFEIPLTQNQSAEHPRARVELRETFKL